jgi:serine protease
MLDSDAILKPPPANPWLARIPNRRRAALMAALALVVGAAAASYESRTTIGPSAVPAAQTALPYEPHLLIAGYSGPATRLIAEIEARTQLRVSISSHPELTPGEQLLALPAGITPTQAAAEIRPLPGVTRAVPDYIARAAGQFLPDDPGRAGRIHGWESLQWNFLPAAGVNAPEAWSDLQHDHRPGAEGVKIAVVDTGVAFRNWKTFKQSPDFRGTRFADPCDLVVGSIKNGICTDPYALDREGHGTFVTGEIAEATNNNYGLTGLAYEATVMPVRVLDAEGDGDSSTIAAGIRYAVAHGAQVINLSIEFTNGTASAQIPDVVSAVAYAHNHNVVVVAASGNGEDSSLDYPAELPDVISVGATTRDRCLAVYSDIGKNLDLVAPGGGNDVDSVTGSRCFPNRSLPDIYQMTFPDASRPSQFGLPSGWFGTSMATPNVSAAAAMVIASGVLGRNPTPARIQNRLEATARPLGIAQPNVAYGYGMVNIGAATSKGGPMTPIKPYSLSGAGTITRVVR